MTVESTGFGSLHMRIPDHYVPLARTPGEAEGEASWPPDAAALMAGFREAWRISGIVFIGRGTRPHPTNGRTIESTLSVAYAETRSAAAIRTADDLAALVGAGRGHHIHRVHRMAHPAGPCVARLAAREATVPGRAGPTRRYLDALAYVRPPVDTTLLTIALCTPSTEDWAELAREFALVVGSVRFGRDT